MTKNPDNDEAEPIRIDYLAPETYARLSPEDDPTIVAAIVHGALDRPQRPWPQATSGLAPLDGTACVEVLRTSSTPVYGQDDGFLLASTPDYIFAACHYGQMAEAEMSASAEEIYTRLLDLVYRRGYPHLLRIWNIVPSINQDHDGTERYKLFCLGRHEAFMRKAPELAESFPSASGVGSLDGDLSVYFLAARAPGSTVENPNQVSAFRYPPRYGPRSPSFSRALVKAWQNGAGLFLSGTASILGHETQNAGSLSGQVSQTLCNLETLTAAAAQSSGHGFALDAPSSVLKAYVRRSEDFAEAQALMERHLGPDVPVLYLQADLCRSELLFEVDGIAYSR